ARTQHRKKYRNAIDRIAEKYKDTAEPVCEYFGLCGGCLFQNIAYEHQCAIKTRYLRELFAGVPALESHLSELTVKGSAPYGYRNRMDFTTSFGRRGLRERGTFRYVVDLERCALMNDRSNELWHGVRSAVRDVEDYNYLTHEGYLRYIVIRSAAYSGQVMTNAVIAHEENRITAVLEDMASRADSVSLLLSGELTDSNYGPVLTDIKRGYIEENFDDIVYRITPNSFFQANSPVSKEIYALIRGQAQGNVLDLFSGVGTISLYAAKMADRITGVEILDEAVRSAKENAVRNGITNAEFIARDATAYMNDNKGRYDTVILDPPRTGAHPNVMKALAEMAPPKIVYMSCNPTTFRDNLLMIPGYQVESLGAWDMFPQTPHVETLAVLTRKI
ncbi:MAG: 23S rRNA (uracil(1939)-C(5))-methyltransferase RlmD, partial [Spirochaetota bacterium]